MSEVLLEYETVLRGRDGRSYTARALGRERPDSTWEGWLEFVPEDGSPPLISGRESTQPNRADLLYWATGLTDPYLDGALLRVQRLFSAPAVPSPAPPHSEGPAVRRPPPPPDAASARRAPAPADVAAAPRPILDPFHVHAEGPDILRAQLAALSADQLRIIIRAYHLSREAPAILDAMVPAELIAVIVTAVEARTP
jgi:hypothetical protein